MFVRQNTSVAMLARLPRLPRLAWQPTVEEVQEEALQPAARVMHASVPAVAVDAFEEVQEEALQSATPVVRASVPFKPGHPVHAMHANFAKAVRAHFAAVSKMFSKETTNRRVRAHADRRRRYLGHDQGIPRAKHESFSRAEAEGRKRRAGRARDRPNFQPDVCVQRGTAISTQRNVSWVNCRGYKTPRLSMDDTARIFFFNGLPRLSLLSWE